MLLTLLQPIRGVGFRFTMNRPAHPERFEGGSLNDPVL
jgi:hypothetical protein